jgi:FMN phosphatase YigB (HAD superfamily)
VARLEACLVDAYDTIVTCDFSRLRRGVPALAGIPVGTWEEEYSQIGPLLTDGRMSKAEAFGHILGKCGIQAPDGLVAEMVRRDQELLLANARLFDDTIPFLQNMRDRGIKIAIVSNCTENTRRCWSRPGWTGSPTPWSCRARWARPSRPRRSSGTRSTGSG